MIGVDFVPITEDMYSDLYKTFLKIKTEEDFKLFLQDLCTNNEIENMAQRLRAAKLIKSGKTYNYVISETDISSATLSRVSKAVKYGSGYKKIL